MYAKYYGFKYPSGKKIYFARVYCNFKYRTLHRVFKRAQDAQDYGNRVIKRYSRIYNSSDR